LIREKLWMYELDETIAAVSSATSDGGVIVRLTGPAVNDTVRLVFTPFIGDKAGVYSGSIVVESDLKIDARVYMFAAPHSYTGQTLAEIHMDANAPVTEALIERLLAQGVRPAGPGEFTARAYLNGKIDLAQAEAVNEIIVAGNKLQLAAAEKVLSGRLAEVTEKIRASLLDLLSLIEAGLDFSGEEIEFVSADQAVERLGRIRTELEQLLAGRCADESVIDLPAVGIAGATNAGKSNLLNRLLGTQRSIVSHRRKTTRDVLTATFTLAHSGCVLFDCAGLMPQTDNILDELAQAAAIEALRNSSVVVFCVDLAKSDVAEDRSICKLIEPQMLLPVGTKSDLLDRHALSNRLDELNEMFGADFLPTSAKTGQGLDRLKGAIDERIIDLALPVKMRNGKGRIPGTSPVVALIARHRQAVTEAIENVDQAIKQISAGSDEIAATMLRAAYQGICDIDRQPVDEQVLENIFSHFCIGK